MVHEGTDGQKCLKNCPHGLWMALTIYLFYVKEGVLYLLLANKDS